MFDNLFIWAQVIGVLGLCVNVITWQLKNPRNIILFGIPANILWAIQYILIDAPLGAVTNICSMFRNLGLAFIEDRLLPYFIALSMLITWAIGFYFYEFWYDLISILSATIINIGFLFRKNRPLIARTTIVYCFLGLIYDSIVGSFIGFVCGLFIMASALIGMYRHENWNLHSSPINLFRSLLTISPTHSKEAVHV